jgi:Ca-activated chloride channel family protein
VKLRYKEPAGEVSQKVEFPLTDSGAKFANASTDFKFAAAVASFGMILRESPHKGTATLADVVTWAESGNTDDAGGYRAEFVELARDAEKLER